MKKQDISGNQVNSVYLAFGSNLGDRKNNLNKALSLLKKENIVIKKKSNLYRSKSWPNENFPEFINFVVFIESNPSPVKYAAKLIGLCDDKVRLPLVTVLDKTKSEVKKALLSAELINE